MQALARHAFVVAAVELACWSISLSDPAGDRLPLSRRMASRDHLTSDEIDGLMALDEPPNPVEKPLLLLLAPQLLPGDFSIPASPYHRVWPELSLCLLPGSHNSVSDIPMLRKTEPAAGAPAPVAADILLRVTVSI